MNGEKVGVSEQAASGLKGSGDEDLEGIHLGHPHRLPCLSMTTSEMRSTSLIANQSQNTKQLVRHNL
jgi:hypothetical protein